MSTSAPRVVHTGPVAHAGPLHASGAPREVMVEGLRCRRDRRWECEVPAETARRASSERCPSRSWNAWSRGRRGAGSSFQRPTSSSLVDKVIKSRGLSERGRHNRYRVTETFGEYAAGGTRLMATLSRRRAARVRVGRMRGGWFTTRGDSVAVEEPMEVRLEVPGDGGVREHPVSVTMRTPGDDFELAAGFLFTEGVVTDPHALDAVRYCQEVDPQEYNVVTASLRDPEAFDASSLTRNFYVTSSCGVCGKASLESVEVMGCQAVPDGTLVVDEAELRALPDRLRAAQQGLRTDGRHSRGGALRLRRHDRAGARGRGSPQCRRQGRRGARALPFHAGLGSRSGGVGPLFLRDPPEGRDGGVPHGRGGRARRRVWR